MTKAPDRPWIGVGMPGYITRGPEPGVYDVEYIPKTLSDALVASAYEAAAAHVTADLGVGDSLPKEILALTPADARAALDSLIAATYEDAAEIASDEDGDFTHWGEDRNTRVSQQTAQDAAKAIRQRTPADARAALAAHVKRAVDEARLAVWAQYDADGYELKTYRITYYAETGFVDGGGMGQWEGTKESHPFPTKEQAEALRDKWLAEGKLKKMHWGEFRPNFDYGAFRIREAKELVE